MFLFTGGTLSADKPINKYGKYQGYSTVDNSYLINTFTGEMWKNDNKSGHEYWKKIIDINKIQY